MKTAAVPALATVLGVGVATCPTFAGGPFDNAAITPADVSVYVHVENAAAIRVEIADRPLAKWITGWLAQGQIPDAWRRLSEAVEMDATLLFDTCLGRSVTVLTRRDEWVLLTEVEPEQSRQILNGLQTRVLGPRHDVSLFELPDHELMLARADRRLLIAPMNGAGLFHEMVLNLAATPGESLAASRPIAAARRLGQGRAGVYVRHAPPMGGWSVAVCGLEAGRVSVRHSSRFDNAPFRTRITEQVWDPTPIRCFEQKMFVSYIEPTDITGGPFDAFVSATLGEPLLTSVLGTNLGTRRITAVADVEGRLADPPFDALFPTFARIYEVNDPEQAWSQVDTHMVRLVAALNRLGAGAFELHVPDPAAFEPGAPRTVDVGPLATWLVGDIPGATQVSLNWTIVDTATPGAEAIVGPPHTPGWCVIASDLQQLTTAAEAIVRLDDCETDPALVGQRARWTSWGAANGQRLSRHLAGWAVHAEQLAPPGDGQALHDALSLVGELSLAVEHCRWRLKRPTPHCMTAELDIDLAEPDSAGE